MSERTYDVVLWGATGFTGRLTAEYLLGNERAKGLRWALGGRNEEKLGKVRDELAAVHPAAAKLPFVIADASDSTSLERLAASTRVVATTVGPFRIHGPGLVAACAKSGTHYADLTGEPHFIRDMIDLHHEEAKKTGAKIVHCCGFDSIPSDLGVFMMQTTAKERFGVPLDSVRFVTRRVKGGISGGTIASGLLLAEEGSKNAKVRKQLVNPYVLDPERKGRGPDDNGQRGVRWDREAKRWTGPFVMAAINTRVVRRTNALLGYAYGDGFRYSEVMGFGAGVGGFVRAASITAGLGAFFVGASVGPSRALLKKVLPSPGEGPSEKARKNGHFTIDLYGEGRRNGERVTLHGVVKGTSDPGYGETAKMLGESALCLAQDDLSPGGGVLTPAFAMGRPLLSRLRQAGMTFEVDS